MDQQALTVAAPPPAHDRRKFIGGADIAAVVGISPWRTPLALWADKVSPPKPDDSSKKRALSRGVRWEGVVGEMLVERLREDGHDVTLVRGNHRYIDVEVPYFAAEIDFELVVDGKPTNCELKTVHPFRSNDWGESGEDDVPLHYLAQVQWGAGVTGNRNTHYLAALFGADELRAYPVIPDEQTIAGLRAAATRFWIDHVLERVPPPATNAADLDVLFPKEAGPELVADGPLVRDLLRLRAIRAEMKAREAEAEALEFAVKSAMRDAVGIVLPTGKSACEWKEREGSFLDQAGLKEAHPKLVREFQKKWTARVFNLKNFSTEGLSP